MFSSKPLPTATAVVAWPTPPESIVFLSQCEFSTWYVQFLPESLLLAGLRVGVCNWFVGEGVWCLSPRRNKVLSRALICYRPSVNDVRQTRGQLIHLGSGTFHSASLLPPGLLGPFFGHGGQGASILNIMFLKKSTLIFLLSLGCLC